MRGDEENPLLANKIHSFPRGECSSDPFLGWPFPVPVTDVQRHVTNCIYV